MDQNTYNLSDIFISLLLAVLGVATLWITIRLSMPKIRVRAKAVRIEPNGRTSNENLSKPAGGWKPVDGSIEFIEVSVYNRRGTPLTVTDLGVHIKVLSRKVPRKARTDYQVQRGLKLVEDKRWEQFNGASVELKPHDTKRFLLTPWMLFDQVRIRNTFKPMRFRFSVSVSDKIFKTPRFGSYKLEQWKSSFFNPTVPLDYQSYLLRYMSALYDKNDKLNVNELMKTVSAIYSSLKNSPIDSAVKSTTLDHWVKMSGISIVARHLSDTIAFQNLNLPPSIENMEELAVIVCRSISDRVNVDVGEIHEEFLWPIDIFPLEFAGRQLLRNHPSKEDSEKSDSSK